MKRNMLLAGMFILIATLAACGSSGSSNDSDTSADITTLDQLPRATSPVVAASGNIAVANLGRASGVEKTMSLNPETPPTFDSTKSMAACEAYNQTGEILQSAAQADMTLCYIQNLAALNSFTGIDIYDGNYHVFDLSISGDEGAPDKVKMKITKTGTVITGFEMFACQDGTQQEYTSQAITALDINMIEKGIFSSAQGSGRHSVTVTGDLNTAGHFTSKEITTQNSWTSADTSTNNGSMLATQTSDEMTIQGASFGTFTGGSYSNRVYSVSNFIDANTSTTNYDIRLTAIGAGGANTINASGDWSGTSIEGWNTDYETDNTVAYYETAAGATPPGALTTAPTIEFTGAQVWDCGDTSEATITGDQTTLGTACAQFGSMNHTWVNCYEQIGPTEPTGE